MYRASALTFTSLLAIVPLMSVTITLFSIFPAFNKLLVPLQDFIFVNFVPSTGQTLQKYLMAFTSQASKLSLFGLSVLFVTTILLMLTIERAMNKIWRVPESRSGPGAFLLYWACLSLTPLLLALSVLASSYLLSLPMWAPDSTTFLLSLAPAVIAFIGFTLLYTIVPNCPIRLRHALSGAFIATLMFELAKKCFTFYLESFNTYELIYGAFSLVPIFFIWIYWLWVITLLCAEITHALSSYTHVNRKGQYEPMAHALRWLYHLYQAQKEGRGLSITELIALDKQSYVLLPEDLIQLLRDRKLVFVSNNKFMLSFNLENISFQDLNKRVSLPYPQNFDKTSDKLDEAISRYCRERHKRLETLDGRTLANWFNNIL
jgi:membrane protein